MKDLVDYNNPKSEIAKGYIDLKDSIVSLNNRNMKTIIITSPINDKEHVNLAANLAVVMSKSGYNTLSMDCNIEKGILGKVFDINSKVGITDYILNKKDVMEVIKNTDLDTLKVIMPGEDYIDVLGNKRMEYLIEEVKKQFDYIIINAPSVLHGNSLQVLARYCDGIVIVIDHEKTEIEDVRRTQMKLNRVKDKVIGCVLNNFNKY